MLKRCGHLILPTEQRVSDDCFLLIQYGLIGSTEWGEDFKDWIDEHVVAYLNLGKYSRIHQLLLHIHHHGLIFCDIQTFPSVALASAPRHLPLWPILCVRPPRRSPIPRILHVRSGMHAPTTALITNLVMSSCTLRPTKG